MSHPRVASRCAALVNALALVTTIGIGATSTAATTPTVAAVHRDTTTPGLTAEESSWREVLDTHPEIEEVWTHSPSMNRNIPLLVLPAAKPHAATVYLLNGVDGGVDDHHWFGQGGAVEFFQNKNVNVVLPVDGKNSYYSDWYSTSVLDRADRGGLRQRWATFLTEELPGPLEASLNANGTRAILGVSMSATSTLQLVEDNPGFYAAAAGLSGCYDTTSEPGRYLVDKVVSNENSGATAEELWGPVNGVVAQAHNPILHLHALHPDVQGRELPLYFSASTGIPDLLGLSSADADLIAAATAGSFLESGSQICTEDLERALNAGGIPATFHYPATGTHSWPSFAEALQDAWPTLARGLFH